jgi:hypothetical protein
MREPGVVIVQRIVTRWNKATRSSHREQRARLPRAYPLPDGVLVSRAPCAVHEIDRRDDDDREVHVRVAEHTRPTARCGSASGSSVVLEEQADGLHVSFRWIDTDCGQPHRHSAGPVVLQPGDRALVRFNGRFVGHENPWYEDKIVHVSYGIAPRRDLFEVRVPSQTLACSVDLW